MPGYYHTLPAPEAGIEKTQHLGYLALGCILFGAATAFVVSMGHTSSLYASVGTQPMVRTIAPTSIPAHQTYSNRVSNIQAAAQQKPVEYESSEGSMLSNPMSAVFGGFALAAAATIAALATKMWRRDDALVSKYQHAEAQWSMTAATAFIGTQAPDFKATAVYDQEFVEVQLSQYRGKKYVVLFFYPLDFTFVCPTEITAFSDRAAEFEAIDTQILGVSVDSQFSHLAWVQTPRNQGGLGEITYPLVADLKKEIAEAYGVLTEEGVALRGLFIIDKEGIIQHATINNLAFGRNVDETLRVLEAVQHVQANPDEVCPAGWKKGDKTMKPDPEGSKEYFQAI